MNPWAWIVAYVAGFALLQLLLYRYFGRQTGGTTSPATPDASVGSAAEVSIQQPETVICGDCGAKNAREPGYRFCRKCTAPLR